MALLTVPLQKSAAALTLCLEKAGFSTPPEAEVGFAFDVSGSYDDEHKNGVTNLLLRRLTPWGMVFDPDKKIDVFTFSDGKRSAHHVGEVTDRTVDGYVADKIVGKVPGYNGATAYSHIIEKTLAHFGWTDSIEKPGFFGRLMGQKERVVSGLRRRTIVFLNTDGEITEAGDEARTVQVLEEAERRGDEIYFYFLGVSNQPGEFDFIEQLGDRFKNVGFLAITDLDAFVAMSDDELNGLLITEELLAWLKS